MFEWLDTVWGAVYFNDTLLFEIYNCDFIMYPAGLLTIALAIIFFGRKPKRKQLDNIQVYKIMKGGK